MQKNKNINYFLERSLRSAIDFFKEAVASEEIARVKGLLQSIDPRVKILLLIAALLTSCFARTIGMLTALYLGTILLASLSGINIIFFMKRVWVFIPLFTALIAIPAIFIQGPMLALIFVLRVATCVSFVVLVTITTRHVDLLRSLKSFMVPDIFIQVFEMSYRYILVLVKIFEEMHLSLKARLLKKFAPREARRWIASRMSFLFKKSLKMSEEVYQAMLARGYTGEIKKYGR